ncbi:Transcription initiation factor TFIID subunit 5 [Astathelohania contejeani]|uniref:Transcription initiation factor TFIID subunit 5 n=1 Tax=Astathelohania contejeani TaxID=164912 RepID=A0ABQ7I2U9_9MICR|nr:Transcription initiation factor TFIID subunit 5 [Thelohania contejeani]
MTTGYTKLKLWIEDSLDLFRNDLLKLLYPLFLHIFFDLVHAQKPAEAKAFFEAHKQDHIAKIKELVQIESISDPLHLKENALAMAYRTNKYHLSMGKYAFDLFINFLEENSLTYLLKLTNQFLEIKVGSRPDGIVEGEILDTRLQLQTSLVSKETEDAILADEQYKYDHLESFVQQLKRQREGKGRISPNASLILAEIEKLKELCKRATVGKNNLPSICCYTVNNCYEGLTCAEISGDSTLLGLGFKDSFVEIHSLTDKPLIRLKPSSELSRVEEEEFREEVGFVQRLIGHSGPVYGLKFFHSGKFFITCSQDCTVRLWSLDLFVCISVYRSHCFPVWDVDVAPNDFYFASAGADKQVCVWSVVNDTPERLLVSALSDVMCVKFHPNSNYIFSGGCDFKLRMHEIQDGKLVRVFSGHTDTVTCIGTSHCGKYVASGSRDRSIILWDIESSRIVAKMIGHESVVYSVGFCYYGPVIASCAGDNTARLWDVTGESLGVYHTKSTPLYSIKFGYRNIVTCVGPFIS